jgi:16S rRNA (guanine527-N7)-methyltransferase
MLRDSKKMPIDQQLTKALNENNILINDQQINQLTDYLALLNKWNRTFNLTAIRNKQEQIYKHIVDSLSIAPFINGQTIFDVGTGPGLPGIPLAIKFPEKHFVLIDSNIKKTNFLQQAKTSLALNNIEIIHDRVEAIKGKQADIIVSRAFSTISDFLHQTESLLAPGGKWLAMKGTRPDQEINAVEQDFCVEGVRELRVCGLNATRHLIIIAPLT